MGAESSYMPPRSLVALLVGFLAVAAHAVPQVEDADLTVELVEDGLSVPTTLAFIGDDDFLILEKNNGQVRRVTNGSLNPTAVLDLAVNGCDERGLLGIAVHPDFGLEMGKDWVYLYYTQSGELDDVDDCTSFEASYVNNLDRFEWNGSALVNRMSLHTFPSFVSYHNGGPLSFGPDKKLYGVNGDGEQDGLTQNEELGSSFDDTGVIFRLNEDGSTPTDNPFDADDDQMDPEDRYFAYGIRNSFGLGWDPESGDLWDTENGPDEFDEINRVVPGGNSGWRDIMGPGTAPLSLVNLPGSSYVEPAYSIELPVAPTGLAFPSSNSSLGAMYEGDLLVADYELGQIYAFEVNSGRTGLDLADDVANNQTELNGFRFASDFTGGITDLEEGPDGHIYVAAIGLGEVWRIRGSGGTATHDLSFTSLKAPKKVTFAPGPPLAPKPLKLSLQNQGTATETIADQPHLDDLLDITISSLGGCVTPGFSILPPKKGFPAEIGPNKKLSIEVEVDWECVNDPAASSKDADHSDYTIEANVDLGALGSTDGDGTDNSCPRAPAVDDKGCGKPAGDPIRVDIVVK